MSLEEANWREQLTQIVDNVASGIVVFDSDGRIIYSNPEASRILGVKRSAMIGRGFLDPAWRLTTVEGQPVSREDHAFSRVMETSQALRDVEYAIGRPDGSRVIASINASPVFGELEMVVAVIGSFTDITARKKSEAALRAEKDFVEHLIDSSVDGILAFDTDYRCTVWNRAMEVITGLEASATLGKPVFDIFPFLRESGEEKYFSRALAGEGAISRERRYSIPVTGRQGFFEAHYSPLRDQKGGILGGLAVIREITERKSTAETLAFLAAIVESWPEAVAGLTIDGIVLGWNSAAEELYGYAFDDIRGRSVTMLIPPDRQDELAGLLGRIKDGKTVEHYRTIRVAKNGRQIGVVLTIIPVRSHEGEIIGAATVSRRETARDKAAG
jgi:PAS domain S-box-containing protein